MNNSMVASFDKERLNIHVENSYLLHDRTVIAEAVDSIIECPDFQQMRDLGFTRTRQSMINEWIAHNFLYYKGYQRDRTGSVDLDEGEPRWRRFVYWVLSILYRDPLK